jgi:nonsense-mediated mRNA decay protein 3
MFCVDCGEEKEIFREGSCLECFLKHHRFSKGPEIINMYNCAHCGAYKFKNNWHYDTFEEALRRQVKQSFSISSELENVVFTIDCNDVENIKTCTVKIEGTYEGEQVIEKHTFIVRLKQQVCDVCSKQFGGYHEAILQIRPGNRIISKEGLLDIQIFVEEQIFGIQKKKNKNLFLADFGREHGGLDFYLSDKQAAFTIIKKLRETYGGQIITSSKNIGIKDGKQVYRDTYLLRLPSFQKGDIIKFENTFYFVIKIVSNRVYLHNLDSNEPMIQDVSDIKKAIIIGNKDLVKEMIVISEKEKEIQVMDQGNYSIFILKKSNDQKIKTETVKVILIDEEHRYLYPFQNQKG